ncbi:MAG: hypothetical protein ISS77_03270 [Phycisphaerae bacterium]|nr:hypothetical protein [Phycisphaerae bacterium]
MERVFFADGWSDYFKNCGISSFDDFFHITHDGQVNKNTKRDVRFFTLNQKSGSEHTFFMKRFFSPHFKDMLFTLNQFGRICSQARCEWNNAAILLKNGTQTYLPVCFGEKTILGIETKSFFITQKLDSICLTDFLSQKWHQMQAGDKDELIVSLGRFFQKIHKAAISLEDLYVWHIFIKESKAKNGDIKYDFAVIDLHRMKHNVKNERKLLSNLGRFHHSMTDTYFDDRLRRLLLESYAHTDARTDMGTFVDDIKKLSDKVSAKRNPKPY